MNKRFLVILCLSILGNCASASQGIFNLPPSLTTIEEQAFYGDLDVEKVVLPEGISSIGRQAFAYSSVKIINLPASLSFIADDAFKGCTLEKVEAKGSYAIDWCKAHGIRTTEDTDHDEGESFIP